MGFPLGQTLTAVSRCKKHPASESHLAACLPPRPFLFFKKKKKRLGQTRLQAPAARQGRGHTKPRAGRAAPLPSGSAGWKG